MQIHTILTIEKSYMDQICSISIIAHKNFTFAVDVEGDLVAALAFDLGTNR